MARRLYYRDSYGYRRRDHHSEKSSGSRTPARFPVIPMVLIAVFVVLASLLRSFDHALLHIHG